MKTPSGLKFKHATPLVWPSDRRIASRYWRDMVYSIKKCPRLHTSTARYRSISEEQASISTAALHHEIGEPFPAPVRFVHGGQALLTGSSVGTPHLWSLDDNNQSLNIGSSRRVLAVAAHHELHPRDEARDKFMIAVGVTNPETPLRIVIWKAEPVASGSGGSVIRTMNSSMVSRIVPTFRVLFYALWYTVFIAAIAIIYRDAVNRRTNVDAHVSIRDTEIPMV
ncbi:hypothetical protein NM688_g2985 [Phlebia brevispora]|uniref:Uncharacterized protein n=1 Tax=Phlebia brevispora TaxID=194682 RepID=A0ACC1T765_9APHY|nr:hypothetical protein NM688_g2985 [Phlebia brevispora]